MLATTDSKKVQAASAGHGPLWQRDYWVELPQSTLSPEAIARLMRKEFCVLAPPQFAKFSRLKNARGLLKKGDEMQVEIRGAGTCEVRIVHSDTHSLTLRTLDGHLEAGRISFGAYYENDNVVIRVRSRARSGSRRRHIAYLVLGHNIQAKLWEGFLQNVAARCGTQNAEVQTATTQGKSTLADMGELDTPTFIAKDRTTSEHE